MINQGSVIPIVGRDLLTVGGKGLYKLLAERLADSLGLEGDRAQFESLNQVATRYLERPDTIERALKLEKVYRALKAVMPADADLPIPAPLLNLARIESFKLFVTTTFDNLLERAIKQVRPDAKITSVSYHPKADLQLADLPAQFRLSSLTSPVVFYLMGKLTAAPHQYALTDEDTLEFMHSLGSKDRSPENLLSQFYDKPVLIIGCGFSDWLARFFIRLTQNDLWWVARGPSISQDRVFAEEVPEDAPILDFLHHFSSRTRIFEEGSVAFVTQLYERWKPTAPKKTDESATRQFAIEDGAVFISYASEDRPVAEAIADRLAHEQIPVWFDRQQLQAGDPFDDKIKQDIAKCSLFAPIISKHVLTPEDRYFRVEWNAALKFSERLPASRRFIVPVAVDVSPKDAEVERDVPEPFRGKDWAQLPGGKVDDKFVSRMKQLYTDYKESKRARS